MTPVVVVGAGIAGLATALEIAQFEDVTLCAPDQGWKQSSTYRAQGGVAVALGPDDHYRYHYDDTVRVARDLAHENAVAILVESGEEAVKPLIRGEIFEMQGETAPAMEQEAGHSRARIVHAVGGLTGRAIAEFLYSKVMRSSRIHWVTGRAVQLITGTSGSCRGIWVLPSSGSPFPLWAGATVLATGGYAALWQQTTNPTSSLGQGHWLAYDAGAALADLEFVQFHPTVLDEGVPRGQALLLTEALRGFGAYLVDGQGHRFMQDYPQQELAPRDEVARAIYQQPQAFLRLDHLDAAELYRRFGDIAQLAAQRGWNLAADPLPVYPAAHFCMGGIRTDTSGRTTVADLYAVGEVAHTGVHGANRLASNSLLEGLVFARRVAQYLAGHRAAAQELNDGALIAPKPWTISDETALEQLGRMMDDNFGVMRAGQTMDRARARLSTLAAQENHWIFSFASLVAQSALERQESRGAHFRSDAPHSDARWRGHLIHQKGRSMRFQALSGKE